STLSPGSFPNITVQVGIPVEWTINAPEGSINGCNNRINIREYGISSYSFVKGDNVIEFTPTETGQFQYSCWMGMIRGRITVIEAGETSGAKTDGDGAGEALVPLGAGGGLLRCH
ncbi:MAG: heavy metal transporter, partial [Oscillospiraceae bacterium]|nr:heavy metal transporter [Oscillospiraceae bacterium]